MIAVPMPRELYISIHALRGEGDICFKISYNKEDISIHALRGEGDPAAQRRKPRINLHIHALRGEGGGFGVCIMAAGFNFNPRPPWGGRPDSAEPKSITELFQSTPSVGRATLLVVGIIYGFIHISIHALRGEGDDVSPSPKEAVETISIHALRGEGDRKSGG